MGSGQPDFKKQFKKTWTQPGQDGGTVAKIKPYTWARIFKSSDANKGIYFTIGVDAGRQSLLIKIHYQEQARNSRDALLTDAQQRLCEELIKSQETPFYNYYKEIPLSEIEQYSLKQLVQITIDFITDHKTTYDSIVKLIWSQETPEVIRQPFVFSPGPGPILDRTAIQSYVVQERTVQPILLHYQISQALYTYLVEYNGESAIGAERNTGDGTFIDMVRLDKDGNVFYEIKTYPSVKKCIREAIGQLIEYSYWPNQQIAKELVIVTPHPATQQVKEYIANLNSRLKLPISYQQFDLTTNQLLVNE